MRDALLKECAGCRAGAAVVRAIFPLNQVVAVADLYRGTVASLVARRSSAAFAKPSPQPQPTAGTD
eukprot:scaffold18561_cov63-Phaeocystis_antarctica.AAC.1